MKGRLQGDKVSGESSFPIKVVVNIVVCFFFRFKGEVKKALESFVEKEDEFIKQVMQQQTVFNEPFSNGF